MKGHSRLFRILFVLLVSLCLNACDGSRGEVSLDNYQTRLFRVLHIDPASYPEAEAVVTWQSFSEVKEGALPDLDQLNISLLDFLNLYGCELQVIVGETNSILGKFAAASQALIRELAFLRVAPECIRTLEEENKMELAAQLRNAVKIKRQNLGRVIVNAVLSGPEAKAFWKAPASLDDYPEKVSIDVPQSIQALAVLSEAWLQGENLAQTETLEKELFAFKKGDGGALLRSYYELSQRLLRLNAILRAHYESEAFCSVYYDVDILNNVITKFFVGDVQVWAAALNQRQYALFPLIQAFEKQLEGSLSETYIAWQAWRESLLSDTQAVVRQHVALLKAYADREKC